MMLSGLKLSNINLKLNKFLYLKIYIQIFSNIESNVIEREKKKRERKSLTLIKVFVVKMKTIQLFVKLKDFYDEFI